MTAYEPVIGLEVHAQLLTKTKLFCGCATTFGQEPNNQTCPVCLGLPGALPVLNEQAVAFAIKFGLAINAEVSTKSVFARKNYFYPDLPKGYQISQFELPVVKEGYIEIKTEGGGHKKIRIQRAHLEEDAGQSAHEGWPQSDSKSYVNLNRAGIPLLEIVTAPDIHTPEEAYAYLKELKAIVQYLDICDGNMEEGSMRCDANVSIRPIGETQLGTRTELKNLNSFNNVRRAIHYEIDRQTAVRSHGGAIEQATLLWDESTQSTRVMRTKEDSHDYRYFPDPDLNPLVIAEESIAEARRSMPELPKEKYTRFLETYGISAEHAEILIAEKPLAAYFESVASTCGNPKLAANWILAELMRELKTVEGGIQASPISPAQLAKLIKLIDSKTISGKIAKDVFSTMIESGKDPSVIVKEKGLIQITDSNALEQAVAGIVKDYPGQVADYRSGKTKIFGFLVGQVMKATKGKANPAMVNEILKRQLES